MLLHSASSGFGQLAIFCNTPETSISNLKQVQIFSCLSIYGSADDEETFRNFVQIVHQSRQTVKGRNCSVDYQREPDYRGINSLLMYQRNK